MALQADYVYGKMKRVVVLYFILFSLYAVTIISHIIGKIKYIIVYVFRLYSVTQI